MKAFNLAPLPFEYNALEPVISQETLSFHHDKHHRAYVDHLNELVPDSGFENASLDQIVMKAKGPLFEQAAQHWNHSFYWNSMSPSSRVLSEKSVLTNALTESFGSPENFKREFEKVGVSLFGSGWLWLVSDAQGGLKIVATKDAGNPIRDRLKPVLVCDLWEHAYYIDYRNARASYLTKFYDVINWDFAETNYLDYALSKMSHETTSPVRRLA